MEVLEVPQYLTTSLSKYAAFALEFPISRNGIIADPEDFCVFKKILIYLICHGKISSFREHNIKSQTILCSSVVYKVRQGEKKKSVPEVVLPHILQYELALSFLKL